MAEQNNEMDNILEKVFSNSLGVDSSRLTPRIKKTLTEFLSPMATDIPQEALLFVLLGLIGQVSAFNRVKVKSDRVDSYDNCVFTNMYTILFMGSGSGKDKAQTIVKEYLLKNVYENYRNKINQYLEQQKKNVLEFAEKNLNTKSAKDEYIKNNKPRFLAEEMGDATLEGFIALREAYSLAGFGGTFTQISEFGDFILSDSSARAEFLSAITEVYDLGDSKAKIIKGEREAKPVKAVPSNIIFHTSLSGMLEGQGRIRLMNFFNRGLARRSFIVYPATTTIAKMSTMEEVRTMIFLEEENRKSAKSKMEEVRSYFDEMYKETTYKKIYICDEEINLILRMYDIQNKQKANQMMDDDLDNEGLKAEMANRYWKVLKLAGIIASFEHPTEKYITKEDLFCAMYIGELSGNHLQKFYSAKPTSDSEKILNLMIKNKGKWLGRTDFYVLKNYRTFKMWFDDNFPMAEDLAEEKGFYIESRKSHRGWNEYRLMEKSTIISERVIKDMYFNNKKLLLDDFEREYRVAPTALAIEQINEVIKEERLHLLLNADDLDRMSLEVIKLGN